MRTRTHSDSCRRQRDEEARLSRRRFLFQRSIDIETYERHSERLREELRLARIAKHTTELEDLDVEGILAFAERVLPRAAVLWVQAQLDQRQRFQLLFFPEGIAFDGERFLGTAATAPAFNYLREISVVDERVVDQTFKSWNRLSRWLSQLDVLRRAA